MKKYAKVFCLLAVFAIVAGTASAQVTITEMVAMDDYVAALIVALGGLMAAIVGGYCAFLLVKKGLKWLNKIG